MSADDSIIYSINHYEQRNEDRRVHTADPQDWRIEDVETVAKALGFEVRKGSGSHVTLSHRQLPDILTVPAKKPIKPVYIRKLVDLIDQLEA